MKFGNLLVVSNSFPDESDTYIDGIFIKDQLLSLSKYFDNIYVLIPAPLSITMIKKMPLKEYDFKNINIHFIKYFDFPPTYFYFREFWTSRETKKVLSFIQQKNIKFDIIHAHNTWRSGAVAVELKKIFKTPVVLTEHTSNVLVDRWINKRDPQFAKIWKACDAIIRVNSKDNYIFKEAGVPEERICTIPNGFKKTLFFSSDSMIARRKLGLPCNKKILLSVGALLPTKGYPYMIDALKEVVNVRNDFHYYIVGSGKLKNSLKKQIQVTGLSDYITLIGGKPHGDIPLWMNACDIYMLPSINEGNPTVMFEALGCGRPFIGTKVGGVPEIISSNDYGILVEPANSFDLADKILQALDRKWNNDQIIAYAERFNWDTIAKEIVRVYSNVMS